MILSFLSVLFCCSAVWAGPYAPRYDLSLADQLFEEFLKTHQRQYGSEQERQMRFSIFKDNLKTINKQNLESKTAVFGITKFSDLTHEEFLQKRTGLRFPEEYQDRCQWMPAVTSDFPESFDWRDHNVVTRVKDQGDCGSCWAFSAIGCLESQYALRYNKLKEFSEQQLVDCDDDDFGCEGGLMEDAFLWLINNGGVMSEEDYPYSGKDDMCQFNETKVQTTIYECGRIDGNNETLLAKQLVHSGPLAIGINADAIGFYNGGIVDHCHSHKMNHGVLLVGYGEEKGTPYWIVKNSWGPDWGEDGYFRIIRNKNCNALTEYILKPTNFY
ncbi:hypothetical protein ABMA28_013862 [Loxostege sticticalis]|uniref:Uncharacterized protein n=1 Tax=Loxostege sticticalis TaxID=481309 RepID=A0ABD0TJT5_LOXSC